MIVIRDVHTVATDGPRGYLQAVRLATLRRGGDFSKRGEGLTETRPVLIFMRKVKKNVVFQRKTGEIQLETVVFQRKTGENGEKILESGGSQGESGESQGAEKKEVPLTRPKDMRDGQRSGTDTK